MEVVARKNRAWWWAGGLLAMMSLSGCGMYPSHPGQWPGGIWGDVLKFVSSIIDFAAKHLGGSYGLALLAVTILVRLIVMPLMIKQIRYQKVMQAMQPEIQKIRSKHQGDNQKIQQETMKLWQEHGVNPMSGCFPMVVQLPVLYALYGAIEGNVKLNQSNFLGIFSLGHPDHYYILPVLAAITTFLSSWLMMRGTDGGGQQKMMLIVMPVFIFIIGSRFPSGLALYWVYTNLWQAVQTYFVRVKPAAAAAAVENTKAPAVSDKSGSGKERQKTDTPTAQGGKDSAQRDRTRRQRSSDAPRETRAERSRRNSRSTNGDDNGSEKGQKK